MDFDAERDTPEQFAFRQQVRSWLSEAMEPATGMQWSATWSTRANEEEYQFRRALALSLGEIGWLFPTLPTEYGGAGLTVDHQRVLQGEIARYGLRLTMPFYTLARLAVPAVHQWGSEEQRLRILPPLTRGEVVMWQLLTEPQGGSDLATCTTIARRDGEDYVVNGQKVMVGSSHQPDYFWTFVNTNPGGPRHENVSWMYIPAHSEGITIQPLHMVMGIKNIVFFDDVHVPANNLIGGENNGWHVGRAYLELEHSSEGGIRGDRTVDRLIELCASTYEGEVPLIDRPEVKIALANMLIDFHALSLMEQRTIWHRAQRTPHPYGGTQSLYCQRMAALKSARRLQDVIGYQALIQDLNVHEADSFEYLARSGPCTLHIGGTLDTDRVVFARRLGLGRRVAEEAPVTL